MSGLYKDKDHLGLYYDDNHIVHYGVKGMKWGVRKAARDFVLGNPKTSIFYKEGRENAKKDAAAASDKIKKVINSDAFKDITLGRSSLLREGGRKELKQDLQQAHSAIKSLAAHLPSKQSIRNFFLGDPKTSVLYSEGRDNLKSELDSALTTFNKVLHHPAVHAVVIGKSSLLTQSGRDQFRDDMHRLDANMQKIQRLLSEKLSHGDLDVGEDQLPFLIPILEDDIIAHAGVKGMRWGIRKDNDSPPSAKSLSDKDLQAAVKRMNLEKQYNDLIKSNSSNTVLSSGLKFTKGILVNVARQQLEQYARESMTTALKRAGVPTK